MTDLGYFAPCIDARQLEAMRDWYIWVDDADCS